MLGLLLDILKTHCKVSPDFDVVYLEESTTGFSTDLDVDTKIDRDSSTQLSLNCSSEGRLQDDTSIVSLNYSSL